MTRSNSALYGSLVGGLPAVWLVSYLLHLYPIENNWWDIPWVILLLYICASIILSFAYISVRLFKFIRARRN